jgi:hypothetical protein
MDFSGYLRWYFRSTLGAANCWWPASASPADCCWDCPCRSGGRRGGLGFCRGVGALVGGFGARAAAAARQAQADKVNAERIASTRALRDKLARLRLSQAPSPMPASWFFFPPASIWKPAREKRGTILWLPKP